MLPEEIEIPLAEVAACCIWGASFYGFTYWDKKDNYRSWHEEFQASLLKTLSQEISEQYSHNKGAFQDQEGLSQKGT